VPAIIVLDANVLIPNALCDLLLRLAEEDLYLPRWSLTPLDVLAYLSSAGAHRFASIVQPYISADRLALQGILPDPGVESAGIVADLDADQATR
jgi:hypothetical protein